MEPHRKLPDNIMAVAIVQLILSSFGVMAGLLLMLGGAIVGGLWGGLSGNSSDAAMGSFIGFLLALLLSSLAIIQFASSIGLFSIQKWAWYGTVITQAIGLLVNVVWLFMGNFLTILVIVVGISILWVMFQPNTLRVFGLRI
ncbi:MAG: hypothetical protein GPJ20_12245 [Microcystis aeruginosa BS13-10]|jgi:hypothetical protein|nr:hypothetical protein [Microcystis aeruginosa G13-09]NCS39663.1 hypothetical protein [Microcystis aeruginosa BS13-10]